MFLAQSVDRKTWMRTNGRHLTPQLPVWVGSHEKSACWAGGVYVDNSKNCHPEPARRLPLSQHFELRVRDLFLVIAPRGTTKADPSRKAALRDNSQ